MSLPHPNKILADDFLQKKIQKIERPKLRAVLSLGPDTGFFRPKHRDTWGILSTLVQTGVSIKFLFRNWSEIL